MSKISIINTPLKNVVLISQCAVVYIVINLWVYVADQRPAANHAVPRHGKPRRASVNMPSVNNFQKKTAFEKNVFPVGFEL